MTRLARKIAATVVILLAVSLPAVAQSDEIQVYEGDLTNRRVVNLTLHNNVIPRGVKAPAFPGAVVADRWEIEAGVGFGLTGASDALTVKLMLSRDLNKKS